jgi:hypothetical protein
MVSCAATAVSAAAAFQALAAGQAPSAVYGAEHLLRLFVKLPELLPPTGEAPFYMATVEDQQSTWMFLVLPLRYILLMCLVWELAPAVAVCQAARAAATNR